MIPDYMCRSRQKNNRRKLVSPIIPSTRAYFPRGVRAGTLNNHTQRVGREFARSKLVGNIASRDATKYYYPNGYFPFPF